MDGYQPTTYGDTWAAVYDTIHPPPKADQLEFLAARAQGGPILELAVGSGRVALPMLGLGVPVHGVEISEEMIARLRSRPGGEDIPIVGSDMTDFTVASRYPLILLGFNTLFAPLEESHQEGVLRSVADALEPDGCFVIDCFVPDLGRFDRGQTVRTLDVTADRLLVEYSISDPERQHNHTMQELRWRDGRSVLLPVAVRYMWPHQIDAIAVAAGLSLTERYEWYDETPFTDVSPRHVSVYSPA